MWFKNKNGTGCKRKMLKQFNKKDIDVIMKIWKDNNQKFQGFIDNKYWIDNYVKAREEFVNNKIYVYSETGEIKAFIVYGKNGNVINIQVKPEIQREGIGEILIQKAKQDNNNLCADVYERNVNAILFFKAMGFRKISQFTDEETQEIVYNMDWNKENISNSTFIYFDNSISDELINKYDKISNIQFYNIHTSTQNKNDIFNIDISNSLESKNNKTYISDYIDVRNKINSIIKTEDTTIFFDCNNDYSYLFNVIKDVIMIKNTNLRIIMHKPFSVEGGKKTKLYEEVKANFKDYNVVDVDYEAIGQIQNITFKEAFEKRDEELLKMIASK